MPVEIKDAVEWAVTKSVETEFGRVYGRDDPSLLVGAVREYFNERDINYPTFEYQDLIPYLPQ
jgi:hypothetical protein